MRLPPPVQAFFDADQQGDALAPLGAFANSAAVKDEGRTHTGHSAIADWWRTSKAKYSHISEPRETNEVGNRITVLAQVSGRFPGSPSLLSFTFTLDDNHILVLEIGA